jgi:hypothetical protein
MRVSRMPDRACAECAAPGPALTPVVVDGQRKTLCADCNPYAPIEDA